MYSLLNLILFLLGEDENEEGGGILDFVVVVFVGSSPLFLLCPPISPPLAWLLFPNAKKRRAFVRKQSRHEGNWEEERRTNKFEKIPGGW